MFKIGDFSRLSQVSVKALRYYDERGLLKPAHVDPTSNYRYYSIDQLPRLNCLLVLKELGFTLDEIARVLDDDVGVAELRDMFYCKRREVEQQVRPEQARLARIEGRFKSSNILCIASTSGRTRKPYPIRNS